MATKKFKTETEYNQALQNIEYKSIMYSDNLMKVFEERKTLVAKPTNALHQAQMLMELVIEKIKEHNAECKRQTTVMKGRTYKRNNIENYQY